MNKGRRERRGGEAGEKRRCVTSPRAAVRAFMSLAAVASECTNRKLFPKYELESREHKAANGKKVTYLAANRPAAFCVFVQQESAFHKEGRYPRANGRAPTERTSQ